MVATQSRYKNTYLTHKRPEPGNQPAFWLRFSVAREAARISQIQLAMTLGISRPSIIAWEHSERIPQPRRARKVLAYLWSLVPLEERAWHRQEIKRRHREREPSVWQLKQAIGFASQFNRTGVDPDSTSSTEVVKPDRESWVEFR